MSDTKVRKSSKELPVTEMSEDEMNAIMKEVERKFALLVSSDEAKRRLFDELIRMSKN